MQEKSFELINLSSFYYLKILIMRAYEIIVDQIINKLNEWVLPWNKPWQWSHPINYETKIKYKWINKLILLFDDYKDKRYLTLKQINKLWWTLKKWSVWTKIIFWQLKESEESKKYNYPLIKYYNVFNIEQTEWLDLVPIEKENNLNSYNKASWIIKNYLNKPKIVTWNKACYNPMEDLITIPDKKKFNSTDDYYSTLFHELIHSTWNTKRLNRFWDKVYKYWSNEYSFEELIAEIGAMFLSHEVWIIKNTKDNSIAYINWWLEYLSKNKKLIIYASSQSQKALDYILNKESINI